MKGAPVARECGDCSLCCKVPQIRQLNKPADHWCPHWVKDKGCGIYAERPEVCRDFQCMWLLGDLPDKYNPRKVRAIVFATRGKSVKIIADKGADVNVFASFARECSKRGITVEVAR
jgi:Fe-S-cluster containining protein